MASSIAPFVPLVPTTICSACNVSPFPVTGSCPAGTHGSPVLLANGLLNFRLPLLSSKAVGTGSFLFVLEYLAGAPVSPPATERSG